MVLILKKSKHNNRERVECQCNKKTKKQFEKSQKKIMKDDKKRQNKMIRKIKNGFEKQLKCKKIGILH